MTGLLQQHEIQLFFNLRVFLSPHQITELEIKRQHKNLLSSSILWLKCGFGEQLNDENNHQIASSVSGFCARQFFFSQKINHWCHLTPQTFILSVSKTPQHVVQTVLWFSLPSSLDREQASSYCVMQDKYGAYVGNTLYHEAMGVKSGNLNRLWAQ